MKLITPSITSRMPANVSQPPPTSSRTTRPPPRDALEIGVSTLKGSSLLGEWGLRVQRSHRPWERSRVRPPRRWWRRHSALQVAISPLSVDAAERANVEGRAMDPSVARGIAHASHLAARDPSGVPVIEHVERVAAMVPEDARSVAFLHDVLGRTPTTIDQLREQGLTRLEQAA